MLSPLHGVYVSTARKESAKEKQLKEEEKILESVAEGRGNNLKLFSSCEAKLISSLDSLWWVFKY